MEHQTLGRRVVCPIGPANQRIILWIVGFLVNGPFSTPHDQGSFSLLNPCTVQGTEERIRYVMLKKSREEKKKLAKTPCAILKLNSYRRLQFLSRFWARNTVFIIKRVSPIPTPFWKGQCSNIYYISAKIRKEKNVLLLQKCAAKIVLKVIIKRTLL